MKSQASQHKLQHSQQESQQSFGKDAYALVGQLGTGRNGTMKLMRNKKTKELVAAKWVPRTVGGGLSKNTEREIVNHRKLLHPNIIRFKEVTLQAPLLSRWCCRGKQCLSQLPFCNQCSRFCNTCDLALAGEKMWLLYV